MKAPLKILLIDDATTSQNLFGFALNELKIDYLCKYVSGIQQALGILQKETFDFIFVDANMPSINNFNTIKRLITKKYLNSPSVIIYTEHPETNLCKRAIKLGVQKVIKKRVEIFELINDLKALLF